MYWSFPFSKDSLDEGGKTYPKNGQKKLGQHSGSTLVRHFGESGLASV
jgi:hypothetical protein